LPGNSYTQAESTPRTQERIAAAKEAASKAAKALEEDVPLIKNAFGK
jgi:hypothetical protein